MVPVKDWMVGHGLLIDLDFAARVRQLAPDGKQYVTNTFTMAGTPAFRSVDIIDCDEPYGKPYGDHWPWHDLESFYWCLLWILTFSFNHGRLRNGGDYRWWYEWSAHSVKAEKLDHLRRPTSEMEDFPARIRPFSHDALHRLRAMFAAGYDALDRYDAGDHTALGSSETDMGTMGGHVTYEKFIAILEEDEYEPDVDPNHTDEMFVEEMLGSPSGIRRPRVIRPPRRSRCYGAVKTGNRCGRISISQNLALDVQGRHYCHLHRNQGHYPRLRF